jgi:uncharacterized protein (DUF1015 family)
VDAEEYADPDIAPEEFARKSNVRGKFAVLSSDTESSNTNTIFLTTVDMDLAGCGRPKGSHIKLLSAKR